MNLCNHSVVKELLAKYGLAPRKGFGQNFLINPDVPLHIAQSADPAGECAAVLEIGPGVGALTSCLAERFEKVLAVEIDNGLIPLLGESLADYDNVTVLNADFMKCDLPALLTENFGDAPVAVCANLPYYITTPVLMKLVESWSPAEHTPVRSITLMIQTEVADRLCAAAGSSNYGGITASLALYGRAEKLFNVSAGNFYPVPGVSSSVIRITSYENGIYDLYPYAPSDSAECADFCEKVKCLISAAFNQRRKTLTNALGGLVAKDRLAAALEELGIRHDVRGEKLSALDYCRLASVLY